MQLTITYYRRRLNDGESMASSRNRNFMLRDYEKNEYSYSKFDAPKMLNKLLGKGLIELPKSSRPEEIRRINDPEYCEYHGSISHSIGKCKSFKRQVLQLAKKEKITLDEEDIKESD